VRAFCGDDAVDWTGLAICISHDSERISLREENTFSYMLREKQMALHFDLKKALDKDIKEPLKLIDTMGQMRMCGATEPRDRIFALYAPFTSLGVKLPDPDYATPLGVVYTQASRAFINHESSLSLLTLCTGSNRSFDAPSWVPDFSESLPPWPVHHRSFDATCKSLSQYAFENDGKHISTLALIVDSVAEASKLTCWHPPRYLHPGEDIMWETLGNDDNAITTVRALQDWLRIASELIFYTPTAQRTAEAFFDTLCLERDGVDHHFQKFLRRFIDPDRKISDIESTSWHTDDEAGIWSSILRANNPEYRFGRQSLETAYKEAPKYWRGHKNLPNGFDVLSSTYSDEWKILVALSTTAVIGQRILTTAHKNTFFRTANNYIGAGPHSIRDGQVVALIPGINMPMILQPVKEGYQVVAPVYIHGMMKGEVYSEIVERELTLPEGEVESRLENLFVRIVLV
jgi:hypothetical protein